jgi:hypothetical protein
MLFDGGLCRIRGLRYTRHVFTRLGRVVAHMSGAFPFSGFDYGIQSTTGRGYLATALKRKAIYYASPLKSGREMGSYWHGAQLSSNPLHLNYRVALILSRSTPHSRSRLSTPKGILPWPRCSHSTSSRTRPVSTPSAPPRKHGPPHSRQRKIPFM